MVVRLAVGQALPLVVPVTQERLLALGTDEVLYVPVLAERGDHPLLDRAAAGATDRDPHLVVAAQAVQLVQLVGRVARPGAHLQQDSAMQWKAAEQSLTSRALLDSSQLQPVQVKW